MTKREYRRIVVKGKARHHRRDYKVIRWMPNEYVGVIVYLTKMTAKSGKIIYAVVVRRKADSKYHRIYKFDNGIGAAWKCYKKCIAA